MAQPTTKFWDMTGRADTILSQPSQNLNRFGLSGGPSGEWVGPGSGYTQDFHSVQAGGFSLPQILALEFDWNGGNSGDYNTPPVEQVTWKMFDYITDKETMLGIGSPWIIRFGLANTFLSPATYDVNRIINGDWVTGTSTSSTRWTDIPYGNTAGTMFDTFVKNGGFTAFAGTDTTTHLLVQHDYNNGGTQYKWFLNYYLYLAIKPKADAQSGLHQDWSFRLNYIYPGANYA